MFFDSTFMSMVIRNGCSTFRLALKQVQIITSTETLYQLAQLFFNTIAWEINNLETLLKLEALEKILIESIQLAICTRLSNATYCRLYIQWIKNVVRYQKIMVRKYFWKFDRLRRLIEAFFRSPTWLQIFSSWDFPELIDRSRKIAVLGMKILKKHVQFPRKKTELSEKRLFGETKTQFFLLLRSNTSSCRWNTMKIHVFKVYFSVDVTEYENKCLKLHLYWDSMASHRWPWQFHWTHRWPCMVNTWPPVWKVIQNSINGHR